MPKYINAKGRIITASSKAYQLIFMEQGYKPADVGKPTGAKPAPDQKPEDVPQVLDQETLNTMKYADIKELARQMEIPRYANTKKNDLINLILNKTGTHHGSQGQG